MEPVRAAEWEILRNEYYIPPYFFEEVEPNHVAIDIRRENNQEVLLTVLHLNNLVTQNPRLFLNHVNRLNEIDPFIFDVWTGLNILMLTIPGSAVSMLLAFRGALVSFHGQEARFHYENIADFAIASVLAIICLRGWAEILRDRRFR